MMLCIVTIVVGTILNSTKQMVNRFDRKTIHSETRCARCLLITGGVFGTIYILFIYHASAVDVSFLHIENKSRYGDLIELFNLPSNYKVSVG